jgi:hypothetical protein
VSKMTEVKYHIIEPRFACKSGAVIVDFGEGHTHLQKKGYTIRRGELNDIIVRNYNGERFTGPVVEALTSILDCTRHRDYYVTSRDRKLDQIRERSKHPREFVETAIHDIHTAEHFATIQLMDMIFSYQRNGDFSETMYYDCLVEEGAEQEQERFLRTCLPLSGTIPDYDPKGPEDARVMALKKLSGMEATPELVSDLRLLGEITDFHSTESRVAENLLRSGELIGHDENVSGYFSGYERELDRIERRLVFEPSGAIPDYDPRADSSIREKQISRLTNEELLTDAVYDELSRIAEIETDSVFNKTYDLLEKSIIGRDEIKLEDELNEMGFGE